MPIDIRPSDRSWSVAYALASTVGSRVAGFVTKWPSLIVEVSRAATASIGTDSCQRTWESYVHAYPKPRRSASWISSSQRENGGSGRTVTPKSTAPSLQLRGSGDQVVAAGDELAHELVRRPGAAGHGQPVALVQVVPGLDLVVRPAQLLAELGLALDAHLERLPIELGQREHLPVHLEHGRLGPERERLLGAGELQAETAKLRGRHSRANASSAFVVSLSRACTESSRCSSFVSSSFVCESPRRDWTNSITVGTSARAISAASWSGPDGSRCEEPATSRTASSASSIRRSSNGIGSIDQTFSHSTSMPSSWANLRDTASALLSISASHVESR